MSSITRFFTWHGRLSRASWLARTLLAALIAIAFGLLAAALIGERGAVIVVALFAWCAAALATRRLHDIGKSAWALIVVIVPIAGPLWLLFQLTRASVEGRNRYGADPDSRFDYLQVDIAR
jgi:uncharacterized membrane protein YhaH (DUF805 family)